MIRPMNVVTRALVALALALLGSVAAPAGLAAAGSPRCERPETGLQGEVPLADQLSGRSRLGYRCGTELVGQNDISHRGANVQLAWLGNCAYVGTGELARLGIARYPVDPPPDDPLWGVAVVDASDSRHPRLVRVLHSPATFNTWEALHTNEARGVLAISGTADRLDLYDASADCRNPVLRTSYSLDVASHGMIISPDGNTVYTGLFPRWTAVDISDLVHPRTLATWNQGAHDVDISSDGTRLFMAVSGSGLVIQDVSDVQLRRPHPAVRTIGTLTWHDVGNGVRLAHIGGRAYVIAADEMSGDGVDARGARFPAAATCPWGFARIVDVTDEAHPRLVSMFSLAVDDATRCLDTLRDARPDPPIADILYSSHYMGLDDEQHTTTAFFTWFGAGLRVVDVRDPAHPTEVAYYNPPARTNTRFRQSAFGPAPTTLDLSTSYVRYRPASGEIWFASVANGFQIVRLVGRHLHR